MTITFDLSVDEQTALVSEMHPQTEDELAAKLVEVIRHQVLGPAVDRYLSERERRVSAELKRTWELLTPENRLAVQRYVSTKLDAQQQAATAEGPS